MDVCSLTKDLVAFQTMADPWEHNCARFLGKMLEDKGFHVRYYAFDHRRSSLVAKYKGSSNKLPLVFTGHIDVVPLGHTQWSVDPFSGETDQDKLFGRGTTDMKGGVAAFVIAAMKMVELNPDVGLTLIITAGEEIGCKGSSHLAQQVGALGQAGALVVGEPTSNMPQLGHHGVLWLNMLAKGVSAHGSMPQEGVNAIYRASKAILDIEKFKYPNEPKHTKQSHSTVNVGTVEGGQNINSVPDRASFTVDCRVRPGQDSCELQHEFHHLFKDHDLDFSVVLDLPAVETQKEDPWVQDVYKICEEVMGKKMEEEYAPFFTDASCLTPAFGNIPTLIMGPGLPEMAHKTDEFVLQTKLIEAQELYERVIAKWCEA